MTASFESTTTGTLGSIGSNPYDETFASIEMM